MAELQDLLKHGTLQLHLSEKYGGALPHPNVALHDDAESPLSTAAAFDDLSPYYDVTH